MSGIYGYVQANVVDNTNAVNMYSLKRWNIPYGKDKKEEKLGKGWGVGCCYEKITTRLQCNKLVLEKYGKHAVIDALLYNSSDLKQQYGKKI